MQSENAGRLKAMIDVASNLEGLIIMPDELDSDIWKLNCKNGVVVLKTGELFPHKREYYMSKICPVEYNPGSKAPRWIDFLNTITGGSKELVRIYLQKAVGSSLSGDISEQAFIRPLWNRSKRKKHISKHHLRTVRRLCKKYSVRNFYG